MLEIKSRHLTWGGPKYYSRRMCLFSGVQERETDGQRGVKLCGISTLSSRSMDFLCGLLKFIL